MEKISISAISPVYNEENRIETMLNCVAWCDEIVILDKSSTDRTIEIAHRYTDKVLTFPNQEYNPQELQILLDNVNNEWVLLVTASDVIHPQLAFEIRKLINQDDFQYDVIYVPYRRFVLGLETKHSPWYSKLHPAVFRKRVAKINEDVHGALTFNTERHYYMPISTYDYMYHLTHATVDSMMERHLRYCRAEARLFSSQLPLRNALKPILRSILRLVFRRKSYLMGWDGITLGIAYMSYWMLRFIYIWELRRSNAPQKYQKIRDSIMHDWEQSGTNKHAL